MKFILASGSKSRQSLLNQVGIKFEVIKSDKEEFSEKVIPEEYVKDLSYDKATVVAEKVEGDALIVAADTVMYYEGKIYEKPKSIEQAADNLRELSGKSHYLTTGMTIKDLKNNKEVVKSITSKVNLCEISEDDIKWYLKDKEIFSRCGYSILRGAAFMKSIEGDHDNVIYGLSMCLLKESLEELGYSLSDFEVEE